MRSCQRAEPLRGCCTRGEDRLTGWLQEQAFGSFLYGEGAPGDILWKNRRAATPIIFGRFASLGRGVGCCDCEEDARDEDYMDEAKRVLPSLAAFRDKPSARRRSTACSCSPLTSPLHCWASVAHCRNTEQSNNRTWTRAHYTIDSIEAAGRRTASRARVQPPAVIGRRRERCLPAAKSVSY